MTSEECRFLRAGLPADADLGRSSVMTETEDGVMRYVYLGDGWTDPRWKGRLCNPVRRADGKCIVGKSKQLVVFDCGTKVVVMRRRLRVVV